MGKRFLALALTLIFLCSPVAVLAEEAPDPRIAIINGAELTPTIPQSAALDAYLDELLVELLADYGYTLPEEEPPAEEEEEDLTAAEYAAWVLVKRAEEEAKALAEAEAEPDPIYTYDMIKACYDYLTANVSYGSHMSNLGAAIGPTTCRSIYYTYGEVEGFGAVALSAKTGMCNAYAAAFILMARKIGLDAYLVRGQTRSGRGGYTYHEWAEVKIGEQVYAFDPQLDQSLARQGLGSYSVFCKTYDQVPGCYIKY